MKELKTLTCIVCPVGCLMEAEIENGNILDIRGNTCSRGIDYANEELTAPKRMVTTTVFCASDNIGEWIPVKTSRPIPKSLVFNALSEIRKLEIIKKPYPGEVLIRGLLCTDADVVVTGN